MKALAGLPNVAYTVCVHRRGRELPRDSNGRHGPPSARGSAEDGATWTGRDERAGAVANYLAEMTGQLESMARAANLQLLAYLLAMARAEAEDLARRSRAHGDLEP